MEAANKFTIIPGKRGKVLFELSSHFELQDDQPNALQFAKAALYFNPNNHIFKHRVNTLLVKENNKLLSFSESRNSNPTLRQQFFSSKTLNIAYRSILDERGEKTYWYYKKNAKIKEWEKLDGGIGINGTTFKKFKKIISDVDFSEFKIINTPFLSVGGFALKYPIVRKIANLFKPVVRINFLQDFLSHRIVAEITLYE